MNRHLGLRVAGMMVKGMSHDPESYAARIRNESTWVSIISGKG